MSNGKRIDFRELLAQVGAAGEDLGADGWKLAEARYIASYRAVMSSAEDYDKYQSFIQLMVNVGYKVTHKSQRRSGENWKGDCDVEITLAAAEAIHEQKVGWLILMSNDSDFAPLLRYARERGVKTAVLSVDGLTAFELKNDADLFLDWEKEDVFRV